MDGEDDARLDVNSTNFDPFLALYSDRVVVPRPDAVVLDNVAKFESLFKKCEDNPVRLDELLMKPQPKKKEPEPTTSKEMLRRSKQSQEVAPKERSEATTATAARDKPPRNVLTRISKASGPLAFLRDCMERRLRVKVWTRNATGIRGYCLGFVVAFDKHWNLALTDVTEVWSRRVKRKTIPLGEEMEPPKAWKAMGPMVTPPRVVVVSTEKGMQTCERHVNQMLMRGEHVVFISVTDV